LQLFGKVFVMVKHYFKVTFRHIRRHLLISILNISGLAIGIACFVLIMLFVNHELNYDRYNQHYDDIYRIGVEARIGNTVIRQTGTPAPMPAAMYDEYPAIRAISRISQRPLTVKMGERYFSENDAAAVDSSFTDIFTLDFIGGDPVKVLNEPRQLLLNETTARKYFGDADAVGQTVEITTDSVPYTVTGVYRDFPAQSHFHFNILVSLITNQDAARGTQWFANNYTTYLRLEPGFPEADLEAALPDFVNRYMFGGEYGGFANEENYWQLYLQHIREIHLGSDLNGEFEANGNITYIRIFSVVAFLVLIVACINFMNLTTASSSIRAREIGIRKTNGASRGKLQQQFFSEAVIVSILALILAMGLVESLMGPYREFTGREIGLHYLDNFLVVPALLGLAILVGLVSGSYPALFMSRFSAVDSMGFKGIRMNRSWFRNILVLFQFSVAIFLISATLVVQKQMRLIMEENLGFNKEQVILVEHAHYLADPESFEDELRKYPSVVQVASSFMVPGDKLINWGYGVEGVDRSFSVNANMVDDTYLETMGMELVKGRSFQKDAGAEKGKVILNETAVRMFELGEDPIGKIAYLWNDREFPQEVIGVVRDYHWESKHMEVRAHALMHLTVQDWTEPNYICVRYNGSGTPELLDFLEDKWEEYIPEIPFEYEFLDEHYEAIYTNEKQTRSLLLLFSFIAIFISCLGLFGLASFMADRRTKEIGIRKANGATTGNILRILSLDFTKWVMLANVIAWPLTWWALNRWLESFAYRIGVPLWVFLAAGLAALVIALLTVSYHALRASRQNPSMSLRYE